MSLAKQSCFESYIVETLETFFLHEWVLNLIEF